MFQSSPLWIWIRDRRPLKPHFCAFDKDYGRQLFRQKFRKLCDFGALYGMCFFWNFIVFICKCHSTVGWAVENNADFASFLPQIFRPENLSKAGIGVGFCHMFATPCSGKSRMLQYGGDAGNWKSVSKRGSGGGFTSRAHVDLAVGWFANLLSELLDLGGNFSLFSVSFSSAGGVAVTWKLSGLWSSCGRPVVIMSLFGLLGMAWLRGAC